MTSRGGFSKVGAGVLVMVLGVAVGVASAWQDTAADRFLESMDLDEDGILSRKEWRGAGSTFVRLDVDRDAYLSVEELEKSLDNPKRRRRPKPEVASDERIALAEVAIGEFPGEAPELLLSNCTSCHDEERILTARKDAGGWRVTVQRMAAKEEAEVSKRDVDRLTDYLEGLRRESAVRALSFGTTDPRAAWARVFDGAELHRFDRDGDGRLSRSELIKLLVDRLDFDGDGELNVGEYALMPVGTDKQSAFEKADRNGNGRVSSREMGVPDGLLEVADTDDDGALDPRELPRLRRGPNRLLFAVDAATVLEVADRNRDGFVNAKELRLAGDLVERFDQDRNSKLSPEEIEQAITRSRAQGLTASFDDLITRFDFDGDGMVSRVEFPGPAVLFRRCDLDGDGVVGSKDAPRNYRRPEFSTEARRWR